MKLAYCLKFSHALRQNEHRSLQAHLFPPPAVVQRSLRQQSQAGEILVWPSAELMR